MARYQQPSDPRDSVTPLTSQRPRRLRQDSASSVPWLWLGLGVVVTLLGLGAALVLANTFLSRQPLTATLPTPTIIRLTAPPSPTRPVPTSAATPTLLPTSTPPATPDLSVAPGEITVGYYAQVTNTGNIGVTVRGGPSTDNVRLLLAPEGTLLLVISGPEQGGDFIWWQVRLEDGTEGWVAGGFLEPAAAP